MCVSKSPKKDSFLWHFGSEELGRRETIRGGVALWVGTVGGNTIRGGVEFPVGGRTERIPIPP